MATNSTSKPIVIDFEGWYAVKAMFDENKVRYMETDLHDETRFNYFGNTYAKIKN